MLRVQGLLAMRGAEYMIKYPRIYMFPK